MRKTVCFMDTVANAITYLSPNVQRLLNEHHVQNLITDQMWEYQLHAQFSMLQSITCADLDGKRYVLDGQHRLAAFKELYLKGYAMNVNIPIVCYQVETFDELKSYYLRINKHHPIQPLETSSEWFENGKSFCTWFVSEYKPYLKHTDSRCNCPHINMNELMKYIKEKHVFERLRSDNNDVPKLIETVKAFNEYMIQHVKYIVNWQIQEDFSKRFAKCMNKNPNRPCIFGVWRRFEWMEIVLHVIEKGVPFSDIHLSQFTLKRTNIPPKKRMEVWKKRNTMMDGVCYVCGSSLAYCDMECGHIVPFVYGGTCQVDNLEPICKCCNQDMGIVNLNEYIKINDSFKG